jgi:hypothetical protein
MLAQQPHIRQRQPAPVQHNSDEPTRLGKEQFREVMQAHHNRQVPMGGL